MSGRRTVTSREEREWLERVVQRGDGFFADAVTRVGFEAVLECMTIAEASGIVYRPDQRRTPWARNDLLKRLLREAQEATSALRSAVEAEVYGR